jgi:4-hydroxybenzoate polyprenyltransferase
MLHKLRMLLDSIKIAHSVFALPFALIALLAAARGRPSWRVLGLTILCMVAARSAAMSFNRWADRDFDAANPRTRDWPNVSGKIRPRLMLGFTALSVVVLLAGAWALNWTCFLLSPCALAVLLGYSYAKRFTSLTHFWLGLALGLAPVAAHLAERGDLWPVPWLAGRWGLPIESFPLILCGAVLLWTAGFDLIYACQDVEHDRRDPRLHSLPKSIGVARSLRLSALLHLGSVALLVAAGAYAGLGGWFWAALAGVAALLVYEHWIVRPDDLSRVNTAFFTVNGAVSLLLLAAVVVDGM